MKNCEEITKDIERASFERISARDRLGIRMHVTICKPCKNYLKDSRIIDELLKKKFRNLKQHFFSSEEKMSLKNSIRKR